MKKSLFLLIIFTTLCLSKVSAQKTFSRAQIFEKVKKKAFVDTLKHSIWVSTEMIAPKTKLKFMGSPYVSPDFTSWFFLIDYDPFADWRHPCKYVFVNIHDATMVSVDGNEGPDFDIQYLLQQKSKVHIVVPVFE